ncbi:PQQ-dependent sugar dehydrogenase [Oxalobacteraceae bacterium R-40]|uniref:PQQ-dependent sugar dehydrogenase n=1 Tax=Keguizhuia sedimenti TaxID=3064264 RepID=A0ABU1BKB3_9BURK|nr:PQQ-dependent sugar dehydrogenase [Oxalobacteraceae bacterium R-40]
MHPDAFAQAPAAAGSNLRTEVVAKGLEHPWGMTFIDGNRFLVTERPGRLRLVNPNGEVSAPIEGLPDIDEGGQGGLLDILADSDFNNNRTIYFCYSEPGGSGNSTALASARLAKDARRLEQVKVLFSQKPKYRSNAHFGCRIVENRDGTLFLTLGDRFSRMKDAQTLDNHHGKIVRVKKDGSIPVDNPFAGNKDGAQKSLPEIWSYGHRNAQGAALDLDGNLWMHEHGPQGGDEINKVKPAKNYGWPVITYGENYGGGKIGEGLTQKAGMEQPVHYWTPSMAPSGMAFLRSDRYGKDWQGDLFVGALKFRYLAHLKLKDGKVVNEEKLLLNLEQRIRDVKEGPDGLLYLLTDEGDGQLIRILPR